MCIVGLDDVIMCCVRVDDCMCFVFFFQAEDGIRDAQESRGLGDVYKRQVPRSVRSSASRLSSTSGLYDQTFVPSVQFLHISISFRERSTCLLYTSDAADDLLCVDLGGRRIIKKKKNQKKY